MKTLINKTRAPIKIVSPGGKALRLGPGKAGHIRDEDADADSVKKLRPDVIILRMDELRKIVTHPGLFG